MTTDVPDAGVLAASPGDRARAAADALGDTALVRWCADLLGERAAYGDPAGPDVGWLAGGARHSWGAPDRLRDSGRDYWVKVWAARTLLYVWGAEATPDLVAALQDSSWRVRETTLRVAARWEVGEAADGAAGLVGDATPRVRAAALRVLAVVGEHEHLDVVDGARDDAEPRVRDAADRALASLASRLDLR